MTSIMVLLFLYIILDVNYFIRCAFTLLMVHLNQDKQAITETTSIYGICTPQDADIFLRHMNNARYLRELNFASIHYYVVTDVFKFVRERGGSIVQSAVMLRYRRYLPILHPYKVETKLIWWDEKSMYFEQQFISVCTGFVHAVALSKHQFIDFNVFDLLSSYPDIANRPEIPDDLRLWLEANDVSSKKLYTDGSLEHENFYDCRASI
ncbi:protein THEM6 [Drosophila mojavensis]|uniref:Protein THEM6 n=1 Tax=Drosophila mojavensis TaxID=7230 RepID=B4KEK5_DROMO|nr:protein THEM6 [Drosophila mojavensis]EDW11884.1 uncharacterized protein Dmoj_GI17389 [Drosophila mojavensis]